MGKTNAEIRKENLRRLISEVGSQIALAERVNTEAAYISQLLSAKPRKMKDGTTRERGVGDDFARRLEVAMHKPRGWMDKDHTREYIGAEQSVTDAQIHGLTNIPLLNIVEISDYLNSKTTAKELKYVYINEHLVGDRHISSVFAVTQSPSLLEPRKHIVLFDRDAHAENGKVLLVRFNGDESAYIMKYTSMAGVERLEFATELRAPIDITPETHYEVLAVAFHLQPEPPEGRPL